MIFRRKKSSLIMLVIVLLIFVGSICVWNKNRPKSMWATNCSSITIQKNEYTKELNLLQRKKVIQFCEKIDSTQGIIADKYDVIIDFHNEIVVLYINTESKDALAKVCAGDSASTAYNYCKVSGEFVDYICKIMRR